MLGKYEEFSKKYIHTVQYTLYEVCFHYGNFGNIAFKDNIKTEESTTYGSDNNNTTKNKEDIDDAKTDITQVFQEIVKFFPEKSWTETDIKNRYKKLSFAMTWEFRFLTK